jgi:hypothetical protein
MIGDTIVLAHEAGTLTPQQMATSGEILEARPSKPADWDLVADFLPPPTPARPAAVTGPVVDAAK